MAAFDQVAYIAQQFDDVEKALNSGWGNIPESVRTAKLEAAKRASRLLGYMDAMEHAGALPASLAGELRPKLNSIVEQADAAIEELESERCDLESRLDH